MALATSELTETPVSAASVFVVILNWNGLADTRDCLRSLSGLLHRNLRVVVVDNGSIDDEAGRIEAEFPQVVLLRNRENLGYAGGNNCGIRHALAHGADYVWLLNNDTTVDPTCLSELVQEAERQPDVGILSPVVYEFGRPEEIQFAGAVLDEEREEHQILHTLEDLQTESRTGRILLWGTALLLRRGVVESVGLLDERYFAYHEDMDYNLRVMAAGLRTLVVPGAKVYHKNGKSLGPPGHSPVRDSLLAPHWYLLWRTHLRGRQQRTYPRRYIAWALERAMNAQRAGKAAVADAILDGAWDALRGHWGPFQQKGRMPTALRTFLSKGMLAWHPYLWLMLVAGRSGEVWREASARLVKRDTSP